MMTINKEIIELTELKDSIGDGNYLVVVDSCVFFRLLSL